MGQTSEPTVARGTKRQSVQQHKHGKRRKKQKAVTKRETTSPVYIKDSTRIRWKKAKESLSLQSDDALATYLLRQFEDGTKAAPKSASTQSKRCIRIVPLQKSASSNPQSTGLYMKTKSGSMIPVGIVSENREKSTQPMANNAKVKQENLQDVTDDGMEATTASDSTTTGQPDDIVDIPLTQPMVNIKTEKPDDQYESEINNSKTISQRNSTSVSKSDGALSEIENAVADTSSRPTRKAKLAAKTSLEHVMRDEETQESLQHSSSDDMEDTGDEISQRRKYLRRSPKLKRMSSKYYQCGRCEVIATEPQTLETHKLEVHGAVDILKCPHCCITYNYNSSLKQHIARVHPEPGQEAEQSDDDEMRKEAMMNLKNGSKYTCKFCPRDFRNIRTWWTHQRQMHVENPDGTVTHKGYACEKCGYVFKSLAAMSAHVKNCDGWIKALAPELFCQKCQKSFDDSKALKEHLKDVHSEEASDLGTKHVESGEASKQGFVVSFHGSQIICKKAPSSDPIVKEIQRLHCPQCDKIFSSKTNLKEHVYSIHSEVKPQFKCRFCPRVYSWSRSVRNHEKTHTEDQERFKCRHCPKSYMTKTGRRDHELKHKGIKLLCNECGKMFATPKGLYSHQRLHKGVKKWQCSYCGKGYYDRCNMKWHENSHTGAKPYTCKYCYKRFTITTARLVHEKAQHGTQYWADRAKLEAAKREKSESSYTCRYCDKSFSVTTARLDHEKKEHLAQYWADCAKSEAAELENVLKNPATKSLEAVSESGPQKEDQEDPTLVTKQGSDQRRQAHEDPTWVTRQGSDQHRQAHEDPTLVTRRGFDQHRQAEDISTRVPHQGFDQQRQTLENPTLVTKQGSDQQRQAQHDPTLVAPHRSVQQRHNQEDPTLVTQRRSAKQRHAQEDPYRVTPQGYDQLDPVISALNCLSHGLEANQVAGQSYSTM